MKWMPDDDAQLLRMKREGKTAREIGNAIGRETSAINARTQVLKARGASVPFNQGLANAAHRRWAEVRAGNEAKMKAEIPKKQGLVAKPHSMTPSATLSAFLLETMQSVREGTVSPDQASAIEKLAGRYVEVLKVNFELMKLKTDGKGPA